METKLTHLDTEGNAIMVDVSNKAVTSRTAVATGTITVNETILSAMAAGENKKGDVLAAARIAGIMAVKKTSDLIPLCHPLLIGKVSVDFEIDEDGSSVSAVCTVRIHGQTGVEMEALTGVSVALLTIYDMTKAVTKSSVITDIRLLAKSGGKSGDYVREPKPTV